MTKLLVAQQSSWHTMIALPWALGAQVQQVLVVVAACITRVAGQGRTGKPAHQPAQGIAGAAELWVQRSPHLRAQEIPHAAWVPLPSLQTQHEQTLTTIRETHRDKPLPELTLGACGGIMCVHHHPGCLHV